MIRVNTDILRNLSTYMRQEQTSDVYSNVLQIMTSCSNQELLLRNELGSLAFYAQRVETDYRLLQKHLDGSIAAYENLETTVQRDAGIRLQAFQERVSVDVLSLHTYHHTSLSSDKSLYSYWKNGVCIGGSIGFAAINAKYRNQSDLYQFSTGIEGLKGSLSADARFTPSKAGNWMPSIALEAKASGSLLNTGASLHVGNRYLALDGDASLGIGVVKAEGKAVLSSKEVTLKGEVGAAAASVEASGSITILGVTFSVSASSDFGGVGAGAEFSWKEGEITMGASASLLAGAGVRFKIDY